ncbi:1191_t:CDS:2 [Diversispora eburnea]|uniref:Large ribosomal subunit protein mL40 n=1 Tax=Diversispora eburnea TaxID=1213867 RepID=A0A9N9BZ76_9GLOM|nr:1191_t:CDS:2 [Diversispora eburnea]
MSSPHSKLSTNAFRTILARARMPGYQASNITDTRYSIIKRILYETPHPEIPKMTEEDLERHKTIERAWKLFVRNRKEQQDDEMAAKYRMLNNANIELEKLPGRLFGQAQLGNKIALFPRQLKIPTVTPPLNGWNYDFTPRIKTDLKSDKK